MNYSPCTEDFYISILSYPTSYILDPTLKIYPIQSYHILFNPILSNKNI